MSENTASYGENTEEIETTGDDETEIITDESTEIQLLQLTPDQLVSVETISEKFIANLFEHGTFLSDFEEWPLTLALAVDTHEFEERKNHKYGPRYQEAVKVFLDSILDFVKSQSEKPDQKENINLFMARLNDSLFGWSPNIMNEMGIANLFLFTARANRIPEIQGWFGQEAVGELVYEISFCRESTIDSIVQKVEQLSTIELLDVINQCQTIGSNAIGNGDWSERALVRVHTILTKLAEHHTSPLVAYEVERVLGRLEEEEIEPTLGIITYQGNRAGGRLPESHNDEQLIEHERLSKLLDADITLTSAELFLRISSDFIGVFDHSGIVRHIAAVPAEYTTAAEGSVAIQDIKSADEFLSKWSELDVEKRIRLILFINRRILAPHAHCETDDVETLANTWHKTTDKLSEDDWKTLFANVDKMEHFAKKNSEEQQFIQKSTEKSNLEASNQFVATIEVLSDELLSELDDNVRGVMSELLTSLKDQLRRDEGALTEKVLSCASDIVKHFSLMKDLSRIDTLSPKAQDIAFQMISASENLRDTHRSNWDYMRNRLSTSDKLVETHDEYYKHQELVETILDIPNVIDGMRKHLSGMRIEASTFTFPGHFVSVKECLTQVLDIFSEWSRLDDVELVLQVMHQPKLKAIIESDLGISIVNIPLRSQIHLLRYLIDRDESAFNRIRHVATGLKENQVDFLKAFLATGHGDEYGEVLLTIAEQLPEFAPQIFAKYGEITDAVDQIDSYLIEQYGQDKDYDEQIKRHITERLLDKGKDILKNFAIELPQDHNLTKIDVTNRISKSLESIKAENELFLGSFKALHKNGEHIPFENIAGVEMQILNPSDIKQEDIQRMKEIYSSNYADKPALQQALLKGFDESFSMKNSRYYALKHNGIIRAFCRLDSIAQNERSDADLYFAAFNVDSEFRGAAIGEAMMEESLDLELGRNRIAADCSAHAAIGMHYIERGFVGTKFYDYHGEPSLSILNDHGGKNYKGKHMDKEAIIAQSTPADEIRGDIETNVMRIISGSTPAEIPFDLLNKGIVLSRYFNDKKSSKVFAVFERRQDQEEIIRAA